MANNENLKKRVPFKKDDPRINKDGRPKGVRNRSTIAREILELMEKMKNPITGKEQNLTQEEIMTLAILKKARGGDVRAYQALMDSGYGQPKQQIETTGGQDIKAIFKIEGQEIPFDKK